ncbi:MAG: hypothetical protein ABSE72_10755, partial [Bacteroidales bacterium]
MKIAPFLVFFSIVLVIYGLINIYIFTRFMQCIPSGSNVRIWAIIIFWVIAGSFIVARFLERAYPCDFTEVMTWIGSFWLGAMAYFIMAVLLVDFARVVNHFIPFFPRFFYTDYQKTKLIAMFIITGLVVLTVTAGFINARNPKIKILDLNIIACDLLRRSIDAFFQNAVCVERVFDIIPFGIDKFERRAYFFAPEDRTATCGIQSNSVGIGAKKVSCPYFTGHSF